MFPIVWLPLTNVSDKTNKEPLEVMRNNKGIAPIYKSDVTMIAQPNTERSLFGISPIFNSVEPSSDKLEVCLGSKYASTIWSGFSMTFFVNVMEAGKWGEIIELNNKGSGTDNYYVSFGTINGEFYVGTNWIEDDMQIVADEVISKWISVAIICKKNVINVYLDGKLKKSVAIRSHNYDGELDILTNANIKCSLFNLKLYNEDISMRHILQDYSCLCGHFKFDGTSAEEPQYNPEYDASGFESDMEMDGYATVTSTYSPSRQLSTLINSKGTFTIPKHMYFTAWIYIPQSSDTLSDVFRIGDNTVLQMAAGKAIKLVHDDGDGLNWSGIGTTPLNNEDMWYFVSVLYDTIDNRIECYINGNLELVYDGPISDGSTKSYMSICTGTIISDLRVFINKPTDSELKYLMNREVTIDEKGTVYATELQEVDYMTTFAFGDRGQIMSPSFESPEYTNQKGVMDYDYINNKLSLRDFEEV